MFGSLRPSSSHDAAVYKANLCGGCRATATAIHPLASLSVGYDLTFLHALLAELERAPLVGRRCTALPFRDVPVRELAPASARWLAALNVLLIEAKCADDLTDGEWKGRLGLRLLASRGGWARDVVEETGFDPRAVTELPIEQKQAEDAPDPSLDALCLPTSRMLGEVFAHGSVLSRRPEMEVPLRQLGQGLGAAIYLKDAREDRFRDARRGTFNAILAARASEASVNFVQNREARRAGAALRRLSDSPALREVVLSLLPVDAQIARRPARRASIRGVFEPWLLCCACIDPCSAAYFCCCESKSSTDASREDSTAATPVSLAEPPAMLVCPGCGTSMSVVRCGEVEVDECGSCFGLWLDHGELESLALLKTPPSRLLTRKVPLPIAVRPEGTRPCPRCSRYMTVTTVKETRLDICSACKGVFLDRGELNRLLDSTT